MKDKALITHGSEQWLKRTSTTMHHYSVFSIIIKNGPCILFLYRNTFVDTSQQSLLLHVSVRSDLIDNHGSGRLRMASVHR